MDNLTHTLCGAALAKTPLGRMSRLAPWSLILGANLPDVDIVSRPLGGKVAYLVHHRGITHSLLGVAVASVLLAALVRWVERRTRGEGEREAPWRAHLAPAAVGLLSHLLLDWLNTYGVRPWLPFASERYYLDLAFIVDPWLWLLFGAIAALAGARTAAGHLVWAALAAASAWIVLTSARSPVHVRAAFPAALLVLAVLRAAGAGRERPRAVLSIGALLVAGYLGLLGWSARTAVRNALERPAGADSAWVAGDPAEQRFAMRSPAIADPFHWNLAIESDQRIYWRRVGLDGRLASAAGAPSARSLERRLDDPVVRVAAALPQARPWRYFARLPWAWIEPRADGSVRVGLSDARYQFAQGPDWCSIEIDLPAGGAP